MLSNRAVTALVKLFATGLLAVTAVGTIVLLSENGIRAAAPGLLGLYLALVLAVGVFIESFFETRLQIVLWSESFCGAGTSSQHRAPSSARCSP